MRLDYGQDNDYDEHSAQFEALSVLPSILHVQFPITTVLIFHVSSERKHYLVIWKEFL